MICQHDPTFQIENEANGGIGCPICNKNRQIRGTSPLGRIEHATRLTRAQYQRNEQAAPKPGWFQLPEMTLEQASTKELIEATARIWNDAQPIEY